MDLAIFNVLFAVTQSSWKFILFVSPLIAVIHYSVDVQRSVFSAHAECTVPIIVDAVRSSGRRVVMSTYCRIDEEKKELLSCELFILRVFHLFLYVRLCPCDAARAACIFCVQCTSTRSLLSFPCLDLRCFVRIRVCALFTTRKYMGLVLMGKQKHISGTNFHRAREAETKAKEYVFCTCPPNRYIITTNKRYLYIIKLKARYSGCGVRLHCYRVCAQYFVWSSRCEFIYSMLVVHNVVAAMMAQRSTWHSYLFWIIGEMCALSGNDARWWWWQASTRKKNENSSPEY